MTEYDDTTISIRLRITYPLIEEHFAKTRSLESIKRTIVKSIYMVRYYDNLGGSLKHTEVFVRDFKILKAFQHLQAH